MGCAGGDVGVWIAPEPEPLTSEYVSEVVRFRGTSETYSQGCICLRSIGSDKAAWYSQYGNETTRETLKTAWIKEVIGQSTIKVEDATEAQLKALYDEYDVETGKPKKYVPAVGDVVEFEEYLTYGKQRLMVFNHRNQGKCLARKEGWCRLDAINLHTDSMTLIESTDLIGEEPIGIAEALNIAEKYFSTPTFEGTYAERQAAWVKHHGIKKGSKVKVVRVPEDDELKGFGCYCSSWESHVGETTKILSDHGGSYLELGCGHDWPYFVLEPVK